MEVEQEVEAGREVKMLAVNVEGAKVQEVEGFPLHFLVSQPLHQQQLVGDSGFQVKPVVEVPKGMR